MPRGPLIAVITCVATLAALAAVVNVTPAFAAACPEYEFIGARGSGESAQPNPSAPAYSAENQYGMGGLVASTYEKLTTLAGGKSRITAYGVRYPAVGLKDSFGNYLNAAGAFLHIKPVGAYTDSVREGTRDVIAHIEARHAECSSTRFVLAGYSQGAQAVGDALQTMPAADRALVVSAAFFGDPYFNARSWSSKASDSGHYGLLGVRNEWPESLHGKIFSYCRPHDPICGISKRMHILGDGDLYYRDFPWFRGFDPHGEYVSSKDSDDAARQVARVLGSPTPVSGSVPLDLVFAIDTTGSMGGVIADVRNNITSLAQTIASSSSDYRFALVDYKDSPEQGDAYRARVDLPFTNDVGAFGNAANGLSADGGGDIPESVYSGVQTALEQPWRNGVRKIVLTIGDAPGKDPEPGTGLTLDAVRAKALAVDPAQVYTVATGGDESAAAFLSALAEATGGKYTLSPSQAEFVATLKDSINAAGSAPVADAGGPYNGIVGDQVVLSGAGSRDEAENITAYDWDFDGDGTYDQTTADPIVTHAFSTTGPHDVVLRARAASGLAGTATATVNVTAVPAKPSAPTNLTATGDDGSVTLRWNKGPGGGAPEYYAITDGAGAVVDVISAQPDGSPPPNGWADTYLANGTPYTYKVVAGNPSGQSAAAGPVTATAGKPGTTPPSNGQTTQTVVLSVAGKPTITLSGRLATGGFTITKSGVGVDSITGTGSLPAAGVAPPSKVTVNLTRRGTVWSGTIVVQQGISAPQTVTVTSGAVAQSGKSTSGSFGGPSTRTSLVIIDPPR